MAWRAALLGGIVSLLVLAGALIAVARGPDSGASALDLLPAASPVIEVILSQPPAAASAEAPAPAAPPGLLGERRICIDPGHDDTWAVGATGRDSAGRVPRHPTDPIALVEHELTLSVAYRLKALLEADGARVCVTRKPREEGGDLYIEPYDFSGDGRVRAADVADVPEHVQPRIDLANDFGAEVLVSIHFNGLDDRSVRGTEAYYTDAEPWRAGARRLAESLISGLLRSMQEAGYAGLNRGARSDAYQRYSPEDTRRLFANFAGIIRANGADPARCPACYRLLTMGANPMSLNQAGYLGVLVEVEFLSNPVVVEGFILRPDSLDIIAAGLHSGLRSFLAP